MRRFFDIYIKLSASPTVAFDPTFVAVLEFYDRLELPDTSFNITTEPLKAELGDGTDLVDGEQVILNCGTYRVEKTEWEKLRTAYHNKPCDFVMWDPQSDTLILAAQGLRSHISVLASKGESVVMKITATKKTELAADGALPFQWLDPVAEETQYSCLISGHIYDTDGVTPLVDVDVQIAEHDTNAFILIAVTDADGHYEILAPTPEATSYRYDFTVTTAGKTFPTDRYMTVKRDGEYRKDISATA